MSGRENGGSNKNRFKRPERLRRKSFYGSREMAISRYTFEFYDVLLPARGAITIVNLAEEVIFKEYARRGEGAQRKRVSAIALALRFKFR